MLDILPNVPSIFIYYNKLKVQYVDNIYYLIVHLCAIIFYKFIPLDLLSIANNFKSQKDLNEIVYAYLKYMEGSINYKDVMNMNYIEFSNFLSNVSTLMTKELKSRNNG